MSSRNFNTATAANHGYRTHDFALDEATVRNTCRCSDTHCECQRPRGKVHCPAHPDKNPSLSVNTTDGRCLWNCKSGCSQADVTAALKGKGPWATDGAKSKIPPRSKANPQLFDWDAAILFDYLNDAGELVLQVGRIGNGATKQIKQRWPKPDGGWVHKKPDGFEAPLWHLPDVLQAELVIVCEGEKAALAVNEALKETGNYGPAVATTNPGGAEKFTEEQAQSLENKLVAVLTDNDAPGARHGQRVAELCYGMADSIRVVALPGLPEKGDAFDFLQDRTVGEIMDVIGATLPWEKPRRFKLVGLQELLSCSSPSWLVHRVLPKGGTGLLTAAHKNFKSFISLDIAMCVATGTPWHGQEVAPGLVIYVAAEGAGGLKNRIKAWLIHHDIEQPQNLLVLERPLKLHESAELTAFITEIRELQPALIVLDTLARCAVGLDENSASDMGLFADSQDRLAKETGAHVLIVHHNNKSGDYRGSSALPAAVDTHLCAERKGDRVELRMEKQKDAEELPLMLFEKQSISIPGTQGEEHSMVLSRVELRISNGFGLSSPEQKVFNALWETYGAEPTTANKWNRAAEERYGIPSSTFGTARRSLLEKKAVLLTSGKPGGKGKELAYYSASPEWAPADTTCYSDAT